MRVGGFCPFRSPYLSHHPEATLTEGIVPVLYDQVVGNHRLLYYIATRTLHFGLANAASTLDEDRTPNIGGTRWKASLQAVDCASTMWKDNRRPFLDRMGIPTSILSTRRLSVSEWRVHAGASISDHQLITFHVRLGAGLTIQDSEEAEEILAIRERAVNWSKFESTMHARMGKLRLWKPAEVLSREYSEILTRTAMECLGQRKTRKPAGYEWWTPELDSLRRDVQCARRRWQDSRKVGGVVESDLLKSLRELRLQYKHAMKEAEITHFKTVSESGNQDPWGLAYRVASGRVRPPSNVLHSVNLSQGVHCYHRRHNVRITPGPVSRRRPDQGFTVPPNRQSCSGVSSVRTGRGYALVGNLR